MKILLSETLSYCFGVRKTLQTIDRLLAESGGKPVFMLGEVVHNERVIRDLKARGLRLIQSLDEADPNGVVVLQSHGSPRSRYEELAGRKLEYVDATCPMVRVIHERVREIEERGAIPVIIGQKGHEEVRGIEGQVKRAVVLKTEDEATPELFAGVDHAGIVVQSTFVGEEALRIVDRIRKIVPRVDFHNTICQPTRTRQREVEEHSKSADCVIIVGSTTSANTRHLFKIARSINSCTYFVDKPEDVDGLPIPPDAAVFIASGASTPEDQIIEVVRRLEERGRRTKGETPCPMTKPS